MIYGHDKTIHRTTHLDVETYKGKVVSVWFRCMALPFTQAECGQERAKDMQMMSQEINERSEIHAVEIKSTNRVYLPTNRVYLLRKQRDCTSVWFFAEGAFVSDVQKAKRFTSDEAAENEKARFGLDNSWQVISHAFYEEE